MPVTQCAILVGGLGTRLGARASGVPKPLVDVGGRPFLAWLLLELCRYGIDDILLLTGHLSDVVEAAVPGLIEALPRPMCVRVSREPMPAGTGGALHHAAPLLQQQFLVLNGDSLFDAPLGPLLTEDLPAGSVGRLMLRQVADASRYGVVTLEGDRITGFRVRPEPGANAGPGVINGGVYRLDRAVLDHVGPECSLEADVLPHLARAGQLRGRLADGWFIDIGVPEDLDRAQTEVPRRLSRPALLLDRDGVCNVDHGWVGTRERFEWIAGALQAIADATRRGWHVFVVTNQSGVARGHYSEDDVRSLLRWMQTEAMRAGGTIDDARYCPYHPEASVAAYRQVSTWRKPAPGMIVDVLRAWSVDPRRCLMIGDQQTDLDAAAAAGVAARLFTGGNLAEAVAPWLDEMEEAGR